MALFAQAGVQIQVHHVLGGQNLRLHSLRYENARGERFSVTRLSYLLSGFALQTVSGEWVELEDAVAWVDLEQRRTFFDLPAIPEADYQAIRFSVGLDPATNHADPSGYDSGHPLNTNLSGLHWTWQTGYIFMALEGRFQVPGDAAIEGFLYHFANDWNRQWVTLPIQLDAKHPALIELNFDIAALLNAPAPLSFVEDGNSSHSREGDAIAQALKTNLASAFQVSRIRQALPQAAAAEVKPIDLPDDPTPYPLRLNRRFPVPDLPRDNPLIEERVALGKRLFNDPILSRDGTVRCASCHDEAVAFSDARRFSQGVGQRRTRRHSMPLFNLAWKSEFFWDGRAPSLREQVLHPIRNPVEMGERLPRLVRKLKADASYRDDFKRAFGSGRISAENISLALENFLLTLVSNDSRFDQAMAGQATLSAEAQRGFQLFMTEFEPRSGRYGADCFHCHGGALFTDNRFHNNGLEELRDRGRFERTGLSADRGAFSTPSLRNVELTAPYMHDGRFETLEEVVAHYSQGIHRSDTLDPSLAKHPAKGLRLSKSDQAALVAFLKSLTDPQWRSASDEPQGTPRTP